MSFNHTGCQIFKNIIQDKSYFPKIIEEWESAMHLQGFDIEQSRYSQEPLVSIWTHVKGNKKKFIPLKHFKNALKLLNSEYIKNILHKITNKNDRKISLLETIIFNKPPMDGGDLHWHQDTSYFPLKPKKENNNWFMTFWIPLD